MLARDEDILRAAEEWRKSGRGVALATVVETWGSAPRPIGSNLVIDSDGNFLGSVSGGCVEGAVVTEAMDVIDSGKPKMLGLDEVADITGHEVGGVCPFGLKSPLPVYCDVSLKAFDIVVPAAGSTHSAVRITPDRMAELTGAEWVDVCQAPAEARAE